MVFHLQSYSKFKIFHIIWFVALSLFFAAVVLLMMMLFFTTFVFEVDKQPNKNPAQRCSHCFCELVLLDKKKSD